MKRHEIEIAEIELAKKRRKIVFDRVSSFTKEELNFYIGRGNYYDTQFVNNFTARHSEDPKETNIAIIHPECFKNMWEYSTVGKGYSQNIKKARLFMKSKEHSENVLSMMKGRRRWGVSSIIRMANLVATNQCTEKIATLWLSSLSGEVYNLFESYVHQPVFTTGQMVQFRSNIGVDSVLKRETYGTSPPSVQFYGCKRATLKRMKKSTFMILEVDPKLEGRLFAKTYSFKEKQGGGRFYKVLPIGEAKTYYVVEKFLKKCRTKAVKDAQK